MTGMGSSPRGAWWRRGIARPSGASRLDAPRTLLLLLAVVGPVALAQPLAAPGEVPGRLSGALEQLRETAGIPGLAVAIAGRDGILWQGNYGFADLEHGVAVNEGTRFRLASASKAVTGVLLARLAAKGTVELDAPIGNLVPDLPRPLREITPRQLAGHLGGVRSYRAGDEELDLERFASTLEALSVFADDPLVSQPGAEYHYSTMGFTLLGAVLEAASGTSFPTLLEEELGSAGGFGSIVPDDPRAIVPGRTGFYDQAPSGEVIHAPFVDPSYKLPGAGLLATAGDLAQLGAALLGDGLLGAEARRELLTPQRTDQDEATGVGLAWKIGEDPFGRRVWHHEGSMAGARSAILVYPDEGLALALLSNLHATPYFAFETVASLVASWLRTEAPACSGELSGSYRYAGRLNERSVAGELRLQVSGGRLSGHLVLDGAPLPVVDGWCRGGALRLVVAGPAGLIPLRLEADGSRLRGGIELQGGQSLTLEAVPVH